MYPRLMLPAAAAVVATALLLGATLVASASDGAAAPGAEARPAQETRPDGWGEATHSNDAEPDYDVVFPEDKVNQITITVDAATWETMLADMTELYGERGTGDMRGPGGFPPPGGAPPEGFPQPPAGGERPEGFGPPPGGPGGRLGGPGGDFTVANPTWVTATIEFEGDTWTDVGLRFKGNSSLMSGWRSGSDKLPFKLDFDEFEDDYPEIKNQRFYGFKQLSLGNNFSDNSFLRETVTYDILEDAGLPAAATGLYEVILDHGDGPVSLGLYTMVEVIDDTVVDRVFGDDSGNIYEADGPAASLADGTRAQIADSFQKENNQEEDDWSDVEALYDVLHAEARTTDPEAWRAALEEVFDVDGFLKWLAISAVIQHWDTYGAMNHNYYLYHDAATDKLTWISWDHNMAMSAGMGPRGGGGGAVDGRGGRGVSLDKANVDANWPLIRYLLDDPEYHHVYVDYVAETADRWFDAAAMEEKYEALAALIEPYAAAEIGEDAFATAIKGLVDQAQARAEAVADFLAEEK